MVDLIDRQAAIKIVDSINTWCSGWLDYAIKQLEELPSAQQEIIRCKDCLMHGVCRFERGLGVDGYCSQAERRTDE